MLSTFQRYFREIALALTLILGLTLGLLAASGLGVLWRPSLTTARPAAQAPTAAARKPALADAEIILQRNIFDSSAPGSQTLAGASSALQPVTAAPQANLTLLGTVAAGVRSLALIKADQEVAVYHLDEELPGGGTLVEVSRNQVRIAYPGGKEDLLTVEVQGQAGATPNGLTPAAAAAPRTGALGEGVRSIGENRWLLPKEEVEKARASMNELLRQARMEPNIVDGRTEGFVVRMIQPRSLLANLGIQRGDVVMQVNGVELDSPEKALQIFQQLREAKNISLSLTRGGNRLNFQYEVN